MQSSETAPVTREPVSLASSPIPGDTGVRYWLAGSPRGLTISVPARDEVYVTVGCRHVRLTAAEAEAISVDLAAAAKEATA